MGNLKNVRIFTNAQNEFFIAITKEAEKLGITEEELIWLLQNPEFSKVGMNSAKELLKNMVRLKYLKIYIENIEISTSAFNKALFASSSLPEYRIQDDFQNWVLVYASSMIPVFTGKLKTLKLTKNMNDSAIIAEIGESNIFTIDEACAILKALTRYRSGELLTNGYANIIYVRLPNNLIIAVRVSWGSGYRAWVLRAFRLEENGWLEGRCVIVRGQ